MTLLTRIIGAMRQLLAVKYHRKSGVANTLSHAMRRPVLLTIALLSQSGMADELSARDVRSDVQDIVDSILKSYRCDLESIAVAFEPMSGNDFYSFSVLANGIDCPDAMKALNDQGRSNRWHFFTLIEPDLDESLDNDELQPPNTDLIHQIDPNVGP